jgi:hypothetical protein
MGWLQVVRYEVHDPGEEEQVTVFDVPPQLSETETPYMAYGIRPTVFDAPSIVARNVVWDANTLVYTPDSVLSRVLGPICGFQWGYTVRDGDVRVKPLSVSSPAAWHKATMRPRRSPP